MPTVRGEFPLVDLAYWVEGPPTQKMLCSGRRSHSRELIWEGDVRKRVNIYTCDWTIENGIQDQRIGISLVTCRIRMPARYCKTKS